MYTWATRNTLQKKKAKIKFGIERSFKLQTQKALNPGVPFFGPQVQTGTVALLREAVISGTTSGVIKGDTTSLDFRSCARSSTSFGLSGLEFAAAAITVREPKCVQTVGAGC